jgi:hypothetical protein
MRIFGRQRPKQDIKEKTACRLSFFNTHTHPTTGPLEHEDVARYVNPNKRPLEPCSFKHHHSPFVPTVFVWPDPFS